jgi:negative regulator of sigma-B (phosphoserine phosphatase)
MFSGAATRSHEGLVSCGDATVCFDQDGVRLFALIDALGHGPDAQKSADCLQTLLPKMAREPLRTIFERCDAELVGRRGAVMSVMHVRPETAVFAGIGNVEVFPPPGVLRPHSVPGTLGAGIRAYREHPLQLKTGQRWVLATDGIRASVVPRLLEALKDLPPAETAEELIARAGRSNDDVGVIVVDIWDEA